MYSLLKHKYPKWLLSAILLFLCLLLGISGCTTTEGSNTEEGKNNSDNKPTAVLIPKATEEKVIGNDTVKIDVSNISKGYFCVKYLGSNDKVKMQLVFEDATYTYDLLARGNYEIFPFSNGNGSYTIHVFENVQGDEYAQVLGESISVKLKNQQEPFLYPNQYVNYTADDPVVTKSNEITENSSDDLDKVDKIYEYVTKKIDYNYDLAKNPPSGYLPNITEVLDTKTGICFDYAAVMTAMLRCQHIPTKLVIGYAGDAYHAWISVYIKDKGWIEGIIQFDGKTWTRMDPTFGAAARQDSSILDFIGDGKNYNAMYFY